MEYKTQRQDDKWLNPFRSWACYFQSILAANEKVGMPAKTAVETLKLYFELWNEGAIDNETTILKPDAICQKLGGYLKFMGKYPKEYRPASDEIEILDFYHEGTGVTHFVLGDGNGRCEWDPWLNSNTVRNGKLRSKRIYKRLK